MTSRDYGITRFNKSTMQQFNTPPYVLTSIMSSQSLV